MPVCTYEWTGPWQDLKLFLSMWYKKKKKARTVHNMTVLSPEEVCTTNQMVFFISVLYCFRSIAVECVQYIRHEIRSVEYLKREPLERHTEINSALYSCTFMG